MDRRIEELEKQLRAAEQRAARAEEEKAGLRSSLALACRSMRCLSVVEYLCRQIPRNLPFSTTQP
jgi:hypothetical protein